MPSSSPAAVPEESIGFSGGRTVDVRELDDRNWSVLTAFEYQAKREQYVVPVGELTDFASVPRPFVWFIPTYGRYTKAAILHDHLCRLSAEGRFDRRDADGVFRQAMRVLGVPFLRRWIMWAAVRWGALVTPEGRRGWWRDVALVLFITLLVLPVVGPAALVIVVTLVVWYIAEAIVWLPLYLVARAKNRMRKSAKRVNPPDAAFRL
jgi:hypothetical protein